MFLVLVRSRRRIGGHGRTEDLRLGLMEEVVIVLQLRGDRVDGHPGANPGTNTSRFL